MQHSVISILLNTVYCSAAWLHCTPLLKLCSVIPLSRPVIFLILICNKKKGFLLLLFLQECPGDDRVII